MEVTLQPITRHNWRAALSLTLPPEQQRFVADYAPVVLIGLAKAYVGALGLTWLPYGIFAGENLVGFVALAYPPANQQECWIFHFFIDQQSQGKGIGKRALQAIIELVRTAFPDCRTVRLTVHPENTIAQALYTKAGFTSTGEQAFDEPLYQLVIR